ncbi:c-type cytochrome [Edaphobacter flagellatus]|uniref:c-type cytochrome n=1 Tax=Edaphobacter flagellatus TaxID=1933044 RepID=UPI0021B3426C|nr:c-type cytochrome [Edaphobacter flagellatus]
MRLTSLCLLLTASLMPLVALGQAPGSQLPEGAHRETVQRACSGCHTVQMFTGRRMTRQQWGTTVSSMIGRGAKITDDEFDQIVGYLTTTFPLNEEASSGTAPSKEGKPPRRPGLMDQVGSSDKQVVDPDAAALGKTIYIAQCITCHGTHARGGSRGTDLVRSVLVLHDRYGSTVGPYLTQGHPKANPVTLTKEQVVNLSHFLHQQIGDTLRSGPYNHPLNILVGDAKAGKLYFEGAGGCTRCHSATGDMAHIASKYEPAALQQRVVFPENRAITKQGTASRQHSVTTVTVTTSSGATVTGEPSNIDDFNISLRDATGQYFSFTRSPDLKVEKNNPYAGHQALLDTYTDKDIHDVVAYLETLQ